MKFSTLFKVVVSGLMLQTVSGLQARAEENGAPSQEVSKERQELKDLKAKRQEENKQIEADKDKLKSDRKSGASADQIGSDRAKIKADKEARRDLRKKTREEREELRKARRQERRENRNERREERHDERH